MDIQVEISRTNKEILYIQESIVNMQIKLNDRQAHLAQLEKYLRENEKAKQIQLELREQQEMADALRAIIELKREEFDQTELIYSIEDEDSE